MDVDVLPQTMPKLSRTSNINTNLENEIICIISLFNNYDKPKLNNHAEKLAFALKIFENVGNNCNNPIGRVYFCTDAVKCR